MIYECSFICGRIHYRGQLRLRTSTHDEFPYYWYEILIDHNHWERIGMMDSSDDIVTDNLMWYELGLPEISRSYP